MNEKIYDIVSELGRIYQLEEIRLTGEVDYIIENHITNTNIIERTMDQIVSVPTITASNLAVRLNNYYLTIDRDCAKEYTKIIRNTYEEDL